MLTSDTFAPRWLLSISSRFVKIVLKALGSGMKALCKQYDKNRGDL